MLFFMSSSSLFVYLVKNSLAAGPLCVHGEVDNNDTIYLILRLYSTFLLGAGVALPGQNAQVYKLNIEQHCPKLPKTLT